MRMLLIQCNEYFETRNYNDPESAALHSMIKERLTRPIVDEFYTERLRLWKEEETGPGPNNELQSIQCWLSHISKFGAEQTKKAMRQRMLLLMTAATALHDEGAQAEDDAGIYVNRPDLRPMD